MISNIERYEANQRERANGEILNLLVALKRTISTYCKNSATMLSYKRESICSQPEVLDLYENVQKSAEYLQKNRHEIQQAAIRQQEVYEEMQKDYEEACSAREDEGTVKIITGVVAVFLGGAAIICTAGGATPIVAKLNYLIDNGYRFVKEGDIWHAIR